MTLRISTNTIEFGCGRPRRFDSLSNWLEQLRFWESTPRGDRLRSPGIQFHEPYSDRSSCDRSEPAPIAAAGESDGIEALRTDCHFIFPLLLRWAARSRTALVTDRRTI